MAQKKTMGLGDRLLQVKYSRPRVCLKLRKYLKSKKETANGGLAALPLLRAWRWEGGNVKMVGSQGYDQSKSSRKTPQRASQKRVQLRSNSQAISWRIRPGVMRGYKTERDQRAKKGGWGRFTPPGGVGK